MWPHIAISILHSPFSTVGISLRPIVSAIGLGQHELAWEHSAIYERNS
jgi:hypothetical protein